MALKHLPDRGKSAVHMDRPPLHHLHWQSRMHWTTTSAFCCTCLQIYFRIISGRNMALSTFFIKTCSYDSKFLDLIWKELKATKQRAQWYSMPVELNWQLLCWVTLLTGFDIIQETNLCPNCSVLWLQPCHANVIFLLRWCYCIVTENALANCFGTVIEKHNKYVKPCSEKLFLCKAFRERLDLWNKN